MGHWKTPVELEIGDTIIWRGDGMQNEEGMILICTGMRGKVITRSENLLAHAARKAGLPITARPWTLVELKNGFRLVVDSRARFERVKRRLHALQTPPTRSGHRRSVRHLSLRQSEATWR